MNSRWKAAFNKLLFCLRIASGRSLVNLVINSKKYHRTVQSGEPLPAVDPPIAYRFELDGLPYLVFLRTFAGDIRMFYEIFLEQVYQLNDGFQLSYPLIIDAGANVGFASLYFSQQFPSARIFCLEPSAANFQILQLNLQQPIRQQTIVAEQVALADKEGVMGFAQPGKAFNAALNESAEEMVDIISMNFFLKKHGIERIGLLKMDIEGAESLVFEGNLGWLEKTEVILIEIHGEALEKKVCKILMEHGFNVYDWNRPGSYCNVFLGSRIELDGIGSGRRIQFTEPKL